MTIAFKSNATTAQTGSARSQQLTGSTSNWSPTLETILGKRNLDLSNENAEPEKNRSFRLKTGLNYFLPHQLELLEQHAANQQCT